MNSLAKKAGYIRGLMEGVTFSDPAQEKLMQTITDLLNELCDRVEAMGDLMDDLNDYVESIDNALSQLEGEHEDDFRLHDDDESDDDDFDIELDDDFMEEWNNATDRLHLIGGKDDASASEDADGEEGEDSEEENVISGAICPKCQKPFFVDPNDPPLSAYICPHCGEHVVPEPLTPDNAPIAKPLP